MQQAQQFHQLQQKTQQMQQMEQTAAHNNGKEESKTASSSTASPPLETCSADVDYCLQQLDAQMSASEAYKLADIHATLQNQSKMSDMSFAMTISSLSSCEQFIYTMERWAQQVQSAQMHLRALVSNTTQKTFHIPIGSYIHSSATGKYYLNLGVEAKTLQGCIYIGYEYSDWFIERVIADECVNFCKLIAFAIKPTLAIKYYDKKCCDLGVTLNGIPVKEKALQEIKITKSIYRNSRRNHLIRGPMLPWLPQPHHNIIKPIENWEDYERKCYFMITEFANCGELFLFIDSYHPIIYREKKLNVKRIDEIKNSKLRELSIRVYRDSLRTSSDGSNAYIELARFLFQQMVQAVHTLHCQGIAHLDISCENFVLHFDPSDGQFLAKLIDFGRATKMKRKHDANNNDKYKLPYEKYDFNVSTYPGKCRYMSPESALFLRYKDADPYDASKEDIYALGVVLFCLLTCRLPYDTPFYIKEEEANYPMGYLNGNKKYQIDLQTMTYVATGKAVNVNEIDEAFKYLQLQGVAHLLHQNCLLDYVSDDSLDLLDQIFRKRMSLSELIAHPFVTTPPNPQLLMAMIQHVVDYKGLEYQNQEKHVHTTTQQIDSLYQNRIKIHAHYIASRSTKKQPRIIKKQPSPPAPIKQQQEQPIMTHTAKTAETITDIANYICSPSPPPQANYICSPSPEIASWSPTPEATSSQLHMFTIAFYSTSVSSLPSDNMANIATQIRTPQPQEGKNLLESHFHVTWN
eukprot:1021879_1